MKDMPIFDTEYGVASLVLREIPYRQEAYIIIQQASEPEKLLTECVSFCRACGAEKILARGTVCVEKYPLHCAIYEMQGQSRVDETKVAHLWPVTAENIEKWRQLMNKAMAPTDNAGTLVKAGEQEILDSNGAYFVHRSGELLGAGWIMGDELMLLAAFEKGAGERVLHTLLSTVPDKTLTLQVASTNLPAIRLYEKAGFIKTRELRRWYRVL